MIETLGTALSPGLIGPYESSGTALFMHFSPGVRLIPSNR